MKEIYSLIVSKPCVLTVLKALTADKLDAKFVSWLSSNKDNAGLFTKCQEMLLNMAGSSEKLLKNYQAFVRVIQTQDSKELSNKLAAFCTQGENAKFLAHLMPILQTALPIAHMLAKKIRLADLIARISEKLAFIGMIPALKEVINIKKDSSFFSWLQKNSQFYGAVCTFLGKFELLKKSHPTRARFFDEIYAKLQININSKPTHKELMTDFFYRLMVTDENLIFLEEFLNALDLIENLAPAWRHRTADINFSVSSQEDVNNLKPLLESMDIDLSKLKVNVTIDEEKRNTKVQIVSVDKPNTIYFCYDSTASGSTGDTLRALTAPIDPKTKEPLTSETKVELIEKAKFQALDFFEDTRESYRKKYAGKSVIFYSEQNRVAKVPLQEFKQNIKDDKAENVLNKFGIGHKRKLTEADPLPDFSPSKRPRVTPQSPTNKAKTANRKPVPRFS